MTDFQDFLTFKFAQVAIGQFKPGKFAEACQLYQEAVSSYGEGFRGAYLLQEKDTDRGISIILWDSQESMEANASEVQLAILRKMAPLFAGAPQLVDCDVVSEIFPPDEGA